MSEIATREAAAEALEKVELLEAQGNLLLQRARVLRARVIKFFQLRNLKQIRLSSGTAYRKQQGTRHLVVDEKLKEILKQHKIPEERIYTKVMVEQRDNDALLLLLQKQEISVEEYEQCIIRQVHSAYLVKVPKRKKSDDQESESQDPTSGKRRQDRRQGGRPSQRRKLQLS